MRESQEPPYAASGEHDAPRSSPCLRVTEIRRPARAKGMTRGRRGRESARSGQIAVHIAVQLSPAPRGGPCLGVGMDDGVQDTPRGSARGCDGSRVGGEEGQKGTKEGAWERQGAVEGRALGGGGGSEGRRRGGARASPEPIDTVSNPFLIAPEVGARTVRMSASHAKPAEGGRLRMSWRGSGGRESRNE